MPGELVTLLSGQRLCAAAADQTSCKIQPGKIYWIQCFKKIRKLWGYSSYENFFPLSP